MIKFLMICRIDKIFQHRSLTPACLVLTNICADRTLPNSSKDENLITSLMLPPSSMTILSGADTLPVTLREAQTCKPLFLSDNEMPKHLVTFPRFVIMLTVCCSFFSQSKCGNTELMPSNILYYLMRNLFQSFLASLSA